MKGGTDGDGGGVDSGEDPGDGDGDAGVCTGDDCATAPLLRAPWNGQTTGSIWATSSALAVNPRRPRFQWDGVDGALGYQLQVDDSCSTPGFTDCDFPSPEVDEQVESSTYVATTDLAVAVNPPVGRRYYWRVRTCVASGCGVWSAVRYLDVGRDSRDFNGDGYADVLAGAPNDGGDDYLGGRAYLFTGRGDGTEYFGLIVARSVESEEQVGDAVTFAGDINADGFADVVVGAPWDQRADVVFGNANSEVTPDGVIVSTAGMYEELGDAVGPAGDVNGDGFADVIVGAPQAAPGRAYIYFGGEGGSFDITPDGALAGNGADQFGVSVGTAGDVNGDGYADVIVGAPLDATNGTEAGAARVYFGAPGTSVDSGADGILLGELQNDRLGSAVAGLDRNGDGFADVVTSAPGSNFNRGGYRVYLGARSESFDATYDDAYSPDDGDRAGFSLDAGDINGDGLSDIAIGSPSITSNTGRVYVSVATAENVVVMNGSAADTEFGFSLAVTDTTGDGFDDLVVGTPGEAGGRAYLYMGSPGSVFEATSDDTVFNQNGQAGDRLCTSLR